jgi:hypothetical protein
MDPLETRDQSKPLTRNQRYERNKLSGKESKEVELLSIIKNKEKLQNSDIQILRMFVTKMIKPVIEKAEINKHDIDAQIIPEIKKLLKKQLGEGIISDFKFKWSEQSFNFKRKKLQGSYQFEYKKKVLKFTLL